MAPKGPHQPAQPYYTQGAAQYGQPGQPNPYMPGASYGQPATDPYAQHSMPDPYAMPSGQVPSQPLRSSSESLPPHARHVAGLILLLSPWTSAYRIFTLGIKCHMGCRRSRALSRDS